MTTDLGGGVGEAVGGGAVGAVSGVGSLAVLGIEEQEKRDGEQGGENADDDCYAGPEGGERRGVDRRGRRREERRRDGERAVEGGGEEVEQGAAHFVCAEEEMEGWGVGRERALIAAAAAVLEKRTGGEKDKMRGVVGPMYSVTLYSSEE